jgi:hypothetical protein
VLLPVISLVTSLCAIAVSVWAARVLVRAERQSVSHTAVSDIYGDFRRLTELRLDNWEQTHVLEPPDNYARTKRLLQLALDDFTVRDMAQHLLQERAVAQVVFQLFEQTLYQVKDAHRVDAAREAFLNAVLNYMTSCLLLNPRMLYLWSAEGGGLNADFEQFTKDYYDAHMPPAETLVIDREGLFRHDFEW